MESNSKIDYQELKERLDNVHVESRKEKQHKSGKLTAWERINLLIDEGTFVETNVYIEHRCTYFSMQNKKKEGVLPADRIVQLQIDMLIDNLKRFIEQLSQSV